MGAPAYNTTNKNSPYTYPSASPRNVVIAHEQSANDNEQGRAEVVQTAVRTATIISERTKRIQRNNARGAKVFSRENMEQYEELAEDLFDELDFDTEALEQKSGLLRNGVHGALEAWARVKATRAIRVICMFAIFAITWQFILGAVSTFTAGVTNAVDSALAAAPTAALNVIPGGAAAALAIDATTGGALTDTANAAANIVGDAAGAVAETASDAIKNLTGINVGAIFDVLTPQFWFEVTTAMTFIFGTFFLLLTMLIFLFFGIKPLWGRHGVLKYVTFTICLVGSIFPLLNMVPWFAVYATVVWLHPR